MTVDQHKAFAQRFGTLHVHPYAPQELADHPEILVIKADENSKHVAGGDWHRDVSCDEEPPMGSVPHIHTVPPDGGGDTMFANMYAAFEALSPPLQRMLEGLAAIHDSAKAHGYRIKQAIAAT
jgi:taurine dioxygenase